jgi:hypothetical protein
MDVLIVAVDAYVPNSVPRRWTQSIRRKACRKHRQDSHTLQLTDTPLLALWFGADDLHSPTRELFKELYGYLDTLPVGIQRSRVKPLEQGTGIRPGLPHDHGRLGSPHAAGSARP